MTSLPEQIAVMAPVAEVVKSGARQDSACAVISFSERTPQRWQRNVQRGDQRPARVQEPANRLSVLERDQLLAIANFARFANLPPSQTCRAWSIKGCTWRRSRLSTGC